MKRVRGFTLIELLVTITLISLLVTVGIASYQASRRNARNAKRRGDMKALQTAFEQYYVAEDGEYPAVCDDVVTDGYIQGAFPTDPSPGASYTTACAVDLYCFCAELEDSEGNAYDAACDFTGPGSMDWFCVQNQQ